MPSSGIPTHAEWKTLKEHHGIESAAVKGVNVGKLLDTFHKTIKGGKQYAQQNAEAASVLEVGLAKYISRLDKKKVPTDYNKFESAFLKEYVGAAKVFSVEAARYVADIDIYVKELHKLFHSTTQLRPNQTTKTDLEKFKQGPLRGLSALGKSVSGIDGARKKIDAEAARINKLIDKTPTDASPALLERIRAAIAVGVEKMQKAAVSEGVL